MISRQFAIALISRYAKKLEEAQSRILGHAVRDDDEQRIPKILEALRGLADPASVDIAGLHDMLKKQILAPETPFYFYTGTEAQCHEMLGFRRIVCEKLNHPHDKYVNRVKTAYDNFFINTLPQTGLRTYNYFDGDERGSNCLLAIIIIAIPLVVPAMITALCALAILAGLVTPVVFIGAALADLCETDEQECAKILGYQ